MSDRNIAKKTTHCLGNEYCPSCHTYLGNEYKGRNECYCINCGQKLFRHIPPKVSQDGN